MKTIIAVPNSRPKCVGVIPARLDSTRLPGKLLLNRTGKPLIQYCWEAAKKSQLLDEVVVATDSAEIFCAVERFGGRAELTGEHSSGTDRVAEVVRRCFPDSEVVVNIQGDEPELPPTNIDKLVESLLSDASAEMATLVSPIRDQSILKSSSCVKAVCTHQRRAIYFSRLPVPYIRDGEIDRFLNSDPPLWLRHIGIYAFRRAFLIQFSNLPESDLERAEKLEQLRAIEFGAKIAVHVVEDHSIGIDTAEDYHAFTLRSERSRETSPSVS